MNNLLNKVYVQDNNGKTILHLICENGADKNLALQDRLKVYFERFAKNEENNDQQKIQQK